MTQPDVTRAASARGGRRWYERPGPSVVVLALVLIGLLLLTDVGGFLSTDVGGKLATLEAMDRRGDLSPDLGYWAEEHDPDGSLYPMFSTSHVGDQWVNVTTLPMLYLALPLYALGGAHLAGLVPVLGTVLAALGAWTLARRLGGDGTLAFWVVGLASPPTIYALDFWEHSLALALMVWGVVFALDASRAELRGWQRAALAGLLFGMAATMRQEAFVYGFVAGGALGVRLLAGGRLLTATARGGAMVLGTGVAILANTVLENWALGSNSRNSRSTGTASRLGEDLWLRLEEAVTTFAGPMAVDTLPGLLVAAVLVALLIELGRRALAGHRTRPVVIGLAWIAVLVGVDLLGSGLRFVPGLAATTPVAVVGLTALWRVSDTRFVATIAVASLPLVWAVQFTGGAGPQWGGRYILLTGTLLAVATTVVFTEAGARAVLVRVAAAGAVVTLVGVAWTVERTTSFATAMQELADRPEPALVFHDPHLAREAGVLVLDERWLAATGHDARVEAARVLNAAGIREVGFVEHDSGGQATTLPGWQPVEETRVPLVSGLNLRLTTLVPRD